MAYVLVDTLRRVGLRFTQFARRLGAGHGSTSSSLPVALPSIFSKMALTKTVEIALHRSVSVVSPRITG